MEKPVKLTDDGVLQIERNGDIYEGKVYGDGERTVLTSRKRGYQMTVYVDKRRVPAVAKNGGKAIADVNFRVRDGDQFIPMQSTLWDNHGIEGVKLAGGEPQVNEYRLNGELKKAAKAGTWVKDNGKYENEPKQVVDTGARDNGGADFY